VSGGGHLLLAPDRRRSAVGRFGGNSGVSHSGGNSAVGRSGSRTVVRHRLRRLDALDIAPEWIFGGTPRTDDRVSGPVPAGQVITVRTDEQAGVRTVRTPLVLRRELERAGHLCGGGRPTASVAAARDRGTRGRPRVAPSLEPDHERLLRVHTPRRGADDVRGGVASVRPVGPLVTDLLNDVRGRVDESHRVAHPYNRI
jgi:hypothetical protein